MKKKVDLKLWESFLEMLRKPSTLNNYIGYYSTVVIWIKSNKKYFTEEILKRNRLDILIKLDPVEYIIDDPTIILKNEANRFEKNKPSTIDTFAMIIGDNLWNMVTIRASKECPNCMGDELRYLLEEDLLTKEQKVILECENCAWIENVDSSRCKDGFANVMPASKEDLELFKIIF